MRTGASEAGPIIGRNMQHIHMYAEYTYVPDGSSVPDSETFGIACICEFRVPCSNTVAAQQQPSCSHHHDDDDSACCCADGYMQGAEERPLYTWAKDNAKGKAAWSAGNPGGNQKGKQFCYILFQPRVGLTVADLPSEDEMRVGEWPHGARCIVRTLMSMCRYVCCLAVQPYDLLAAF
eukprot:COSAG06_NODE_2678_length_6460_cov_2.134884_2_plen_178_part_00